MTKWTEAEMLGKMNKVHHIDCLEFMKQVPDNYFDLVLTDPPYGINFAKQHTGKGWVVRDTKEWDKGRPEKKVFDEILRISKNQIIWGGNYFADLLSPSQCWLAWDKGQRDFSLADGELAWTSYDKAMRFFTISRAEALQEKRHINPKDRHPTQKPTKLMEWCLDIAKADNTFIIFDPFMGSGTTAVACKSLGLDWCGCELEADYVEIANKRLEAVQGSLF